MSANEPRDDQQDNGADRGRKDCADNAGAETDAESGKQQSGDKRADDPDHQIAREVQSRFPAQAGPPAALETIPANKMAARPQSN